MVALALGVEVRPALAPAHRQAGQRVFEGLFKGEEFEDAFIDRGVKADAAFIGSDGVVVLHTPAALDADIVVVVFPADAERYDAVGFGNAPQYLFAMIAFLVGEEVENILGHLLHRLDELGLARVAFLHALHECGQVDVIG
jgi:hypothetical protein